MGQVGWARELAEKLLAEPLPRRWAHTQGVAGTARRLSAVLGDDAELIEAAAWLHDVGYAPNLVDTGFHPLDGARYLRDVESVDPGLCDLVAYHTCAICEAQERGLESDLVSEFSQPPRLLADALTYCDITTSPDGDDVDVRQRIADVLERYGPEHVVSRTVRKASASYIESVQRIEDLLSAGGR